ncbi:MAG: HAMP domain-containing methyl-accepting chemotaxis protein [Prochlorothrix sp.]|nr:methyl-accepting chemotaxis protein [Prochlorothrix sp.]
MSQLSLSHSLSSSQPHRRTAQKLSTQLYLGFAVPAVIILGMGCFSLYSFQRIDRRIGTIYDDRIIPLQQLKRISDAYAVSVIDAVNKAHARTWTMDYTAQVVQEASLEIEEVWGEYLQTELTPEEAQLVREAEVLFDAADQEILKLQQVLSANSMDRLAVFDGSLYTVIDPLSAKLQELIDLQLDVAAQERQVAAGVYLWTRSVFWVLLLLALVLASPLGYFFSRKVTAALKETIDAVAQAVTEISSATEEHERISAQQASSVQETAATIEQLNAFATSTAQQAETVATESKSSLDLTEHGGESVQQILVSIQDLQQRVSLIAERINHLSDQAQQIGSISELVSDLANQTNMLALNAAVEAVRAGSQGKGFGIVAQEVRKLADQSKQASEKINVLVGDIQSAIGSTVVVTQEGAITAQNSVAVAENSAQAFKQVAQGAESMMLSGQQIALSAEQQAKAIQETLVAIRNLNQAATETITSISQTKVGMQQLNSTMLRLQEMV